jgi:coenzyme F420-0:L-glutamate ligase/coenzyme F420-1:gamma-L-glutamate ligase
MTPQSLSVVPLPAIGEIASGTDLAGCLLAAVDRAGVALRPYDIVVVAQKIVSKAEGRFVTLDSVEPSMRAQEIAGRSDKDPRLVELILRESSEVLRVRRGVVIVRHRLGYVMAQAGIDQSNVPGEGRVLLLPFDPDGSAETLRQVFEARGATPVGVVISDSFGRAWRLGTTNIAIGAAGVPSLWDRRGECDRNGRVLEVTEIAFADAVAAAAGLVIGEAAEGMPAVVVRGLHWSVPTRPALALIRPPAEDMFT